MSRYGHIVAVLALSSAVPAVAEDADDFMNGVYAGKVEDCAQLKKGGLAGLEESAVLTAEGLYAYEYTCEFVDLKAVPGTSMGWVGMAFCEEPDFVHPDVVAISPHKEGSVRATFLSELGRNEADIVEENEPADAAEAAPDEGAADAAPEEEKAAQPEADDPPADEEADPDVYVFCAGVTKDDLQKVAPDEP